MSLQSNHHLAVEQPAATPAPVEPREPQVPALEIDITTDTCPMTFVRTRLALDRLASGQILAVRLRGAEAVRNVPRTSAEQGHSVLAQTTGADGVTRLLLRRK